jgi:hypothetical protein
MDNELAEALRDCFIDKNGKNIVDALGDIAFHLKYLGVGDAATTMGAIECLTTTVENGFGRLANQLSESLEAMHEPLRSDHPLQGKTLSSITVAVKEIAEAIRDAAKEK